MIEKELLHEIMQDTSCDGKLIHFYEMLQDELNQYSETRIKDIKETLKFAHPKLHNEIDEYDKLKTLYEYSLLP